MNRLLPLGLLAIGFPALAATHHVKQVAVDINGTKFWLPSTITVRKGDKVKLHLTSVVPMPGGTKEEAAPHGYQIPAFGVEQVVDHKPKEVEFTASKAGVFPINCHLHPAHVGGQLVVLE